MMMRTLRCGDGDAFPLAFLIETSLLLVMIVCLSSFSFLPFTQKNVARGTI